VTIDSNGNLTQKVDGSTTWTYEWNAESQLTRVLNNGNEVARFRYDPFGRRVEKVAGGVTTAWAYDGQQILRETSGATTLKFVHGSGIDEPLAQEDSAGALSYFHADTLGSIVKTTNAAGAVVASKRYDAFGNLELGAANGAAFTGREWDSETGLYYYRARYYDPRVGRFIGEDPIGFKAGANFYAYVMNRPTAFRDPLGLSAASCLATCLAAAGAAAAGAAVYCGAGGTLVAPGVGTLGGGAGCGAAWGAGALTVCLLACQPTPTPTFCPTRTRPQPRTQPKKGCHGPIGSGGCTNNAGKPGAPAGLSKRCDYVCDDGTQDTIYLPCTWSGDDPPCPVV
jgi:RHS repeat-associated protein